jgi:hypothetical protein
MNIMRLLYESVMSIIIVLAFFTSIYYRIKALFLRIELRKMGVITVKNLFFYTFINMGFWMFPLFKFRNEAGSIHRNYLKNSNIFLAVFFVLAVLLIITHKILW